MNCSGNPALWQEAHPTQRIMFLTDKKRPQMAHRVIDCSSAQRCARIMTSVDRGCKPLRSAIVWQTVSLVLSLLLALPPQTARAAQAEPPTELNIVIVEGEGAVNNLRQRVVREPIVRVEDQNHKPVAGAAVSFLLPGNGAGGTFADGAKLLTVTTDANGQAVARGFKANNVAGKYQIRVTASQGKVSTTATISQANAVAAAGAAAGAAISAKLIIVLAIVGAAAAGGAAYAATRGGSSSSSTVTPTTGLSAGSPSVGAPH
jgi:hypothetical protein